MSAVHLIRPVRNDDLTALLSLYRHLHPTDPDIPADEISAIWEQIVSDRKVTIFVAEAPDGTIVSSCTLVVVPNLTRGSRPYALIENVVTHADFRKQGFGSQILAHAIATAWEQHCYKVMLMTGSKQEATLRFYERAGFQRGTKTGFVINNGTPPPRP